ncbi:MAG: hypothetical protein PHE89_00050 [Alphaproteobacteria bacterium]|nr:hypothetical protein [Alphaproteobacteria bacterium]
MNYQEILKKDKSIIIVDYSLVNVMGTLLGFDGEFNLKLYNAMLEAEKRGEKILLYSVNPPSYLKSIVNLKKFPCIGKEIFFSPQKHIVLGKVIDDNLKKGESFSLSNEQNLIHPDDVEEYVFSRDELPEGLENPLFKI